METDTSKTDFAAALATQTHKFDTKTAPGKAGSRLGTCTMVLCYRTLLCLEKTVGLRSGQVQLLVGVQSQRTGLGNR